MRQSPFKVDIIRELLAKDKIESAIKILLENLKEVLQQSEAFLMQSQNLINSGFSFLIPNEILSIINEFRDAVTILSASTRRIENDFKKHIIEWETRNASRNKIIYSMNTLMSELENFNWKYGDLFPSMQKMLPSPGEPGFLEKAHIYTSIIHSLSHSIEEFSHIKFSE